MLTFFTIISSTIIFSMSLLHLLLLFGAPLGEYVLGGNNRIIPKKMRYINVIFTFIWFMLSVVYLIKGNLISIIDSNNFIINLLFIISTLFFGFAIFSNAFLTESKKEKYTMTPLCTIVFISSLVIYFL